MTALTSVERVKAHLSIKGATPDLDAYFERVLAGASRLVETMSGQRFGYCQASEILNPPARGEPVLVVAAPILSVQSFKVAGVVWPLVDYSGAAAGFALERGLCWTKIHAVKKPWPLEMRSVVIEYSTGFAQTESGTCPATPYMVKASAFVAQTLSVTIDGNAAIAVQSAPIAGQYREIANGLEFAAADAGKAFAWQYAATPPDIELAVLDIAATAYAARDRVGVTSKSLAGQETVSFSQDAVPPSARATIQLYKAVF